MTLTWGQQYSKKDAIKYLQKVAGLLLKIVKQLKQIIVKSKQAPNKIKTALDMWPPFIQLSYNI